MTGEGRRRLPPLRMLASFEALARLGSRQAAAAELNVTPGAVGKQLRALEQWIGVRLFENDAREAAMTQAGRLLAQSVTAGMETMMAGLDHIAPVRTAEISLRILAPAALAMHWLVPRLPELERALPHLRVSVHATHTGEDWMALPHDVVIRRDGFLPPGYASEFLWRESLMAVAAPSLLQQDATPDTLPLLESRTRAGELDRWLAAAGVAQAGLPRRSFAHFYIAYEAAQAGEGLLVAPSLVAAADMEVGRLLCLRPGVVVQGTAYRLLYRPTGDAATILAPFLGWLREQIPRLEQGTRLGGGEATIGQGGIP